jgi:hypothetical protein
MSNSDAYLFRFNVDRKNYNKVINDKKKSKKVELKEELMEFGDDLITLYININKLVLISILRMTILK